MPHPSQGLGIDLELDRHNRLSSLGAVLGEHSLHTPTLDSTTKPQLNQLTTAASFVFGHNILHHDLPWLAAHHPDLPLLQQPAVDTLYLSALLFAEHPYHALIKDYKLVRDAKNDPVADCHIAGRILASCTERLHELAAREPSFIRCLHALALQAFASLGEPARAGAALFFGDSLPPAADLAVELRQLLAARCCRSQLAELLADLLGEPDKPTESRSEALFALLFATAWLRVAGSIDTMSPSVPMPWVRQRFPAFGRLLQRLRDTACAAADCSWCRSCHDPRRQLARWYGYDDFRPEPTLGDGRPAQRAIVEAGFAEKALLALLPTGGGKSLCFQLPAIVRYLRRGCLSVVISPLQSLMHDQVDNFLAKTQADCAYALTGRLTPPERRAVLDAVGSGRAGILYVSPEQLRNRTFRKTIAQREIGAWIFDEAHCLSKWGHDFRPDYLYAARFIKEFSLDHGRQPAPVVAVTATAKPEVREEILQHFADELGQQLLVFDGHAPRQNLTLQVEEVEGGRKVQRLRELVAEQLALDPAGSVLVYTATRSHAEKTAFLLARAGIAAVAFHAGLEVPTKKAVQEGFLAGEHPVVCATNAFGMGIDKPNIRLVVHYEIPGSLEAYVQEVGRAGRDNLPARAVLLLDPADTETQFRLAASSRLDHRDVSAILLRVRSMARPLRDQDEREVVCTTGEILHDEQLAEQIDPQDRGAPTRVVTAIAWLERGKFLRRDENAMAVFQGRPLVQNLAEAKQRIAQLGLKEAVAAAWLELLQRLLNADMDDGFSSDDLLGLAGVASVVGQLSPVQAGRKVLDMLLQMQKAKLLSSGVLMTAFVKRGVAGASKQRLAEAVALEDRILDLLRQHEPDVEQGRHYPLSLRLLLQQLELPPGPAHTLLVQRILSAMADRGEYAGAQAPGLKLLFCTHDQCRVTVQGSWDQIRDGCRRRHHLATVCLDSLLQRIGSDQPRSGSLLVEFSLESLREAMDADLELRSSPSRDPATEIEYALLYLHRIGALVLHKGLAVFRQAMVLRVPREAEKRRYTKEEFAPLAAHQDERTVQIHAMHEFARRMVSNEKAGLQLLDDYFQLPRKQFFDRYWRGRQRQLERATSPDSWRSIMQGLSPSQRSIVEAKEDESLLVLAGPGSGKTRVVVHRCAYLLRVKRVPARAILVLCYNRSAALELRSRLRALVGGDANGVLVQTYHGMAARILGNPPVHAESASEQDEDGFQKLMRQAVSLLQDGVLQDGTSSASSSSAGNPSPDELSLRDRLLAGFRHILVDEYQDIDEIQYQMVSAIAGRTLRDPDRKLTVLAVGDDDQNIYEFRQTSVEFLRRFAADYQAQRRLLVENYRSTAHIVAAANLLIAQNRDRLKHDAPLRVDGKRQQDAPGGRFASLPHPAQGRVQILELAAPAQQPFAVLQALQQLADTDPEFAYERCAVLSPRHHLLDRVRTQFEREGIPFRRRIDAGKGHSIFQLRELQQYLAAVERLPEPECSPEQLQQALDRLREQRPKEPHFELVAQYLADYLDEYGDAPQPKSLLREFFAEQAGDQRRERTLGSGVMLSTVHGSKGAEYDHVIVLDGGWQLRGSDHWDTLRRLYYVAMTRARQTLCLLQQRDGAAPWLREFAGDCFWRTPCTAMATAVLPELGYELLGLADIHLSYAGREPKHEEIAAATAALRTGDTLQFLTAGEKLLLADASGQPVAALSQKAVAQWRDRLAAVLRIRVAAVLRRQRNDESEEFRQLPRREEWLVVVPELTVRR